MKSFLVGCLVIAFSAGAQSQDSTTTLSAFETFITKSGSIIKTEITTLGEYGAYKVLRCTATDITTAAHTYAIRVDNN